MGQPPDYRAKAAKWAARAKQPGQDPATCLQLRDSYISRADTVARREAMERQPWGRLIDYPDDLIAPRRSA